MVHLAMLSEPAHGSQKCMPLI